MLTFEVKGGQSETFTVTVKQLPSGDIHMTCSCWAGAAYNICRHRMALLAASQATGTDIAKRVSGAAGALAQLHRWLHGTELGKAAHKVLIAERVAAQARRQLWDEQRNLVRVITSFS